MSSLAALEEADGEFRRLLSNALQRDVSGAPASTEAFLAAMGRLEERIKSEVPAETVETLQADVERKRALYEKQAAALATWKQQLQDAVARGERVLMELDE